MKDDLSLGTPPVSRNRARASARPQIVALTVLCALCLLACSSPDSSGRRVTRVLSYNVQNLFDGTDDGGEYAEFRSDAGWNRARYYARLERLDDAIRLVSGGRVPEIVVLQELESARVAADISRDFLRRHRYIAAGPAGQSTTQVAVLSRVRPRRYTAHRVVEVEPGAGGVRSRWQSRDMVDVRFAAPAVRLIAAHWKSQSGGEARTERKRILEASLVAELLRSQSEEVPTLLVGDLNEDLYEYRQHDGAWPTALMHVSDGAEAGGAPHEPHEPARGIRFHTADDATAAPEGEASPPRVRTLWDESSEGSYAYRGVWERLDHAFLIAPPEYQGSLTVGHLPELIDNSGVPHRFDARTGRGYSDHLPVLVTLTRHQSP